MITIMIDQPTSAPQRGTGLAFLQHWDWAASKGLLPKATAVNIRSAVSAILRIEDDWETLDVRGIDVDGLIGRFRNLSNIAPNSLATYESRFRSGLESYLAYLDNPTSYRPKGRAQTARNDKAAPAAPKGSVKRTTKDEARPDAINTARDFSAHGNTRLVVYPFPVRADVFAELRLPADLTVEEANRLSAFLKAVAISQSGGTE